MIQLPHTMIQADWDDLKHFSRKENWGDPNRMDAELVHALDDFRAYVGRPVIIHCGTQGTHTDGSVHYLGKAVDMHVHGMHAFDAFIAASRFPAFRGIGLYLEWNNPGLHLDNRDLPLGIRALWMKKNGVYVDISRANLKGFF
jgi:uncharacterized protein YcbK (DUF882 family)